MVRITGIAFGWIGLTIAFGAVVRSQRRGEGRGSVSTPYPGRPEFGPDAGERKQGPVFVEGKLDDVLFFVSGFGSGAYSEREHAGHRRHVADVAVHDGETAR